MLLDRRRTKFWQKIVFGFMAVLMASFLIVGYSGVASSCEKSRASGQVGGDYTKRVDAAAKALQASPSAVPLLLSAAQAYQERGLAEPDASDAQKADLKQALTYYAAYLQAKDAQLGGNAKQARIDALTNMVVLNSKLGDAAAVVSAYNTLSNLDPKNADYYLQLGTWAERAGNTRLAYLSYTKYLELQPDSQYAPLVKKQLKQIRAQIASGSKTSPVPSPSSTK